MRHVDLNIQICTPDEEIERDLISVQEQCNSGLATAVDVKKALKKAEVYNYYPAKLRKKIQLEINLTPTDASEFCYNEMYGLADILNKATWVSIRYKKGGWTVTAIYRSAAYGDKAVHTEYTKVSEVISGLKLGVKEANDQTVSELFARFPIFRRQISAWEWMVNQGFLVCIDHEPYLETDLDLYLASAELRVEQKIEELKSITPRHEYDSLEAVSILVDAKYRPVTFITNISDTAHNDIAAGLKWYNCNGENLRDTAVRIVADQALDEDNEILYEVLVHCMFA